LLLSKDVEQQFRRFCYCDLHSFHFIHRPSEKCFPFVEKIPISHSFVHSIWGKSVFHWYMYIHVSTVIIITATISNIIRHNYLYFNLIKIYSIYVVYVTHWYRPITIWQTPRCWGCYSSMQTVFPEDFHFSI